ncbi:hypothetical protein [Psychroserpens mesophilus]|uniref:hypothetical protein n=1 Tax=Psychroserpens mesophilus TaxID=325473 RepID=UPI00058BF4DB|nr:hypothetical protein [Psychroserpens mesophilus]
MKSRISILLMLLLLSCSSTQLVESWKNPDIDSYEPYKVLVVGLTSDETARLQFEEKLKQELELRGYEVVMSFDLFKTEKMNTAELDSLESQLIKSGFDTILLTKIIGVEEKITYSESYKSYNETYRKFKDEFLKHQDIYYSPNYYNAYQIYKAETSVYCICPTKDRELIWKGYINITDPQAQSIEKTVNDYVKLAILVLEEEQLIKSLPINNQESTNLIN